MWTWCAFIIIYYYYYYLKNAQYNHVFKLWKEKSLIDQFGIPSSREVSFCKNRAHRSFWTPDLGEISAIASSIFIVWTRVHAWSQRPLTCFGARKHENSEIPIWSIETIINCICGRFEKQIIIILKNTCRCLTFIN